MDLRRAGPLAALLAVLGSARMEPAPVISRIARAEGDVASADGVRIRYQTAGEGEPAIVFVHGWTCDRSFWDAQLVHFARKRRVVALDLAGHGASGRARMTWTIPAFAEDVRAVVLALGLERVVLVGHSMGGPVILEAARRMPERIVALIPVDIFFDVERKLTPESKEAFLAPLRQDFPSGCRELVTMGMFHRARPRGLSERVANAMCAASPSMAIAVMEGIWEFDVPTAMEQVSVPIHCINSDRRRTDVEAARRHARRFEVDLMKGVGHFVMMERPSVFNRLLDQALREIAPPAASAATPSAPGRSPTP